RRRDAPIGRRVGSTRSLLPSARTSCARTRPTRADPSLGMDAGRAQPHTASLRLRRPRSRTIARALLNRPAISLAAPAWSHTRTRRRRASAPASHGGGRDRASRTALFHLRPGRLRLGAATCRARAPWPPPPAFAAALRLDAWR